MRSFEATATFGCPRETLASWHFREGALERLVPPWSGVRVERSLSEMRDGAVAVLGVPLGPLPFRARWEAVHEEVRPGERFVDRMVRGPFRAWRHVHRFGDVAGNAERSTLEDAIAYELPLGPLGALGAGSVRAMLARTFAWRHRRTQLDLARHAELSRTPKTIAISGASGLVGGALAAFLTTGGHRVRRLVRGAADAARGDIAWDPARGTVDLAGLAECDAVVHLAGESIASRWSAAKKARILESRVRGTTTLANAIARVAGGPRVLVSASAIGFYGDRGADRIDESASTGSGFLADVCRAWEGATSPAAEAGVRVVNLRIGMVLSSAGAALKALLTPFSLGLGGPVGSGRQGMSWIALDDLLAAILFAINTDALEGPVNAVGPAPCDNRTFGATLGRVLRRPAFLPLPSFAVSTVFGEMGRELLLGGAFVRPTRLFDAGFRFDHSTLESALRFELGRLR
jgi:uncharacterized protein (TIGR01777 family)